MTWEKTPAYILRRQALAKTQYVGPDKLCRPVGWDENAAIPVKDIVDGVYSVLSTLDTKASALMRLNGVLVAASAFLLEKETHWGLPQGWDPILIILSALLSVISMSLCLFVVRVGWPFLGKVDEDYSFLEEIECLERASRVRQWVYRTAWHVSLVASLGFLVEFLGQTFSVITQY